MKTKFFYSIVIVTLLFSCGKEQLDPDSMPNTKTANASTCSSGQGSWSWKTSPVNNSTTQFSVEYNYSVKQCNNQPVKVKMEMINTSTGVVVSPLFDTPLSFKYTHSVDVWEGYHINVNVYDATTNELIIQHPFDFAVNPFKVGANGIW